MTKAYEARKRRARREKTVQVLKMVALGALIIGIGAAPSPRAISSLLREFALGDTSKNRKYAVRKISEMKKLGLLEKHGVKYAVSDKGERALSYENMLSLEIPKPTRWDGKWHFIMFDIPLAESEARKALNRILLGMGCTQYQQSVLIYPFPVKETVLHVCRFYKISRYVSFVSADIVDGEDNLRKHFKLS